MDEGKTELQSSPPAKPQGMNGQTRKRKAIDFDELGTEMVTLKPCGFWNQPKYFSVHKSLAFFYSPVLRAAFTRQLNLERPEELELRGTPNSAVALLLRWMYTGKLHDRNDELPGCSTLIDFWVLADGLSIPEAQNLAIQRIKEVLRNEKIAPETYLKQVYEITVPGSPLRKLLIDQMISMPAFEDQIFYEIPDDDSREILLDLAIALRKRIPDALRVMEIDPSSYMVPVPAEEAETT